MWHLEHGTRLVHAPSRAAHATEIVQLAFIESSHDFLGLDMHGVVAYHTLHKAVFTRLESYPIVGHRKNISDPSDVIFDMSVLPKTQASSSLDRFSLVAYVSNTRVRFR
jgi:hypothetical protein